MVRYFSVVELVISNSYSLVKNATVDTYKRLRAALSYIDDSSRFTVGYGSRIYLIDSKGNFPTGLKPYVLKVLENDNYTITDTRVCPPPGKAIRFKLRLPFQLHRDQELAVDEAVKRKRGTISAVTGFGKSVMIASLIQKLGVKTLIIVPNLQLKQQLKENFTKYFGNLDNITIKNIDASDLEKHKNYDCLIIDESHHVAAKTYRTLNRRAWGNIYYRFFFTGTPFRTKSEEQMLMESISGQVLYTIDYHKAVAAGAIVPIEAYYIEVPRAETDAMTWPEVYSERVVKNTVRNAQICSLLNNLVEAKASALVLVKELAHGRLLSDMTGVPFASGEDGNSKALIDTFNKGSRCLIGTIGVLGEGCDTRPAEYVVIAALGKSKPQFMQMVGRGLRRFEGKSSAKIIIFKDRSHKFTLTHFKEQVKILREEYGVDPVSIE